MKIIISHVYSKYNNGDAAILSSQIAMMRAAFDDPLIQISSIEPAAAGENFDGVPVRESIIYGAVSGNYGRMTKVAIAAAMLIYTSLWAWIYSKARRRLPLPRAWRGPVEALLAADLQVCVGGGYLRAKDDLTSTVLLALLLHEVRLAKVLGKPVYLCAQSFGPYPRRLQRALARAVLPRADLILVREAKSHALLASLGISPARVLRVPDSAFDFQPERWRGAATMLGIGDPAEQLVGVTVRAWLPDAEQRAYERAVADFVDRISRKPGLRVVIVAQVTAVDQNDDDRVVAERIHGLLGPSSKVMVLMKRLTHHEIKSVFDSLTYLVGTRFHSAIFALTSGVPTIAIEYEHKTSGIMQDLGLESWVIPIEDVTAARLSELFGNLVAQREPYRRHLRAVLPDYVAAAGHAGELIRRSYDEVYGSQSQSGRPTRSNTYPSER